LWSLSPVLSCLSCSVTANWPGENLLIYARKGLPG
jgi:hypothetical protein